MRVIRIVPVLAILTATVLVASVFAFSVVGSVDATHLPEEPLQSIKLRVDRVDIVHTDDQAVKRVITVRDFDGSPITIELLDLQSGILTELGICDIDDDIDGFVTQFRIVVTDATITFNGETDSLKIPAGVVRFNGVVSVPADEDAVFDFDAEKSLISKPSGFQLKSPIKFVTTNADC